MRGLAWRDFLRKLWTAEGILVEKGFNLIFRRGCAEMLINTKCLWSQTRFNVRDV